MHEQSVLDSTAPRIRVVHLITSLCFGGAEQQLKQLVLASDCRHFEHFVISMSDLGSIGEDLQSVGLKVHSLGMTRGKPSLAGIIRLVRFLRQIKPDVFHCWLYHSCLLGILAGRFARIPKVVWCLRSANEQLLGYRLQTRAVVKLCGILSRFPDAIVLNSESGRSLHTRWGYYPRRMQAIPNGVDLDLFRPNPSARLSVREELGIPSGTLLIGLVARFHPMKDHNTFFCAAQRLRSRLANSHFVLAGSGVSTENPELLDLVRRRKLQAVVHLLGPRFDIPRLTAALDIACLSSSSESFPNVICEAMACGVPCAVTNVGDASRIVGDTGRVVPSRNPEALAQALFTLLEMPPGQRTNLGQKARERAKVFSFERAVSAYEALYTSLVERIMPRNLRADTIGRPDSAQQFRTKKTNSSMAKKQEIPRTNQALI